MCCLIVDTPVLLELAVRPYFLIHGRYDARSGAEENSVLRVRPLLLSPHAIQRGCMSSSHITRTFRVIPHTSGEVYLYPLPEFHVRSMNQLLFDAHVVARALLG